MVATCLQTVLVAADMQTMQVGLRNFMHLQNVLQAAKAAGDTHSMLLLCHLSASYDPHLNLCYKQVISFPTCYHPMFVTLCIENKFYDLMTFNSRYQSTMASMFRSWVCMSAT